MLKSLGMKCEIWLLLFLLLVGQVNAQKNIYRFKKVGEDKWGYANINGKTIIEPQFNSCTDFSDCGIAITYEFMYSQGEFINVNNQKIEPEPQEFSLKSDYSENYIQGFQNGFIVVTDGNRWGYINTSGKLSIPFKYDDAFVFSENFAIVKLDKNYLILDTNGVETSIKVNNVRGARSFSEGLARITINDSNYSYVNFRGDVVINVESKGCGYFSSGLTWVRSKNKKIGFIDKSGIWKIEPKFEMVHDFDKESGMAMVKENGKLEYIDTVGNVLIIDFSLKLVSFSGGLVRGFVLDKNSENKSSLVGFIDNKGKWVIEPVFENARDFKNGFAAVRFQGKWGFIDKTGKWVIEPVYEHIGDVIKIE